MTEKAAKGRRLLSKSELKARTKCGTIVVRVLRSWTARNTKKNGEPMSLDMLLLDEMDTVMQASIHVERADPYASKLKDGHIYSITDFDVVDSPRSYRMTDVECMVRFTDRTVVAEVDDKSRSIGVDKFRFMSYEVLMQLANRNKELPDVIGLLSQVVEPDVGDSSCSKRAELRIFLKGYLNATVTVWSDKADEFCETVRSRIGEQVVVIVTSINPKFFGQTLYLNTTSASKLYVDPEIDEVWQFRKSMSVLDRPVALSLGTKMPDLQSCRIADIYEFLHKEDEQVKDFICVARITEILTRNGWHYISCSKCSSKVAKTGGALICSRCSDVRAVGILRFRIECMVADNADTATFVIFDGPARKCTNTTAEEILGTLAADSNVEIPDCISRLVGKTFKFFIKVKPFDFRSMFRSFTVSRMLEQTSKHLGDTFLDSSKDSAVGGDGPVIAGAIDETGNVNEISALTDVEKDVDHGHVGNRTTDKFSSESATCDHVNDNSIGDVGGQEGDGIGRVSLKKRKLSFE